MNESLDLKGYFNIFKKRSWIVASLTLIAILISGIYSFFIATPIYQAELTFMVNFSLNENSQITTNDMEYGATLVNTYKPIISSSKVTKTIKDNLDLKISQETIGKSIKINSISGPVMKVTVQNSNPSIAKDIANEVPEVFGGELKRIAKVDGIEVIDYAKDPKSPISPNKTSNIIKAVIVAIVIGIFIIFLLDYLDNKVKTQKDIEQILQIPVIGVVPEFNIEDKISEETKNKKKGWIK